MIGARAVQAAGRLSAGATRQGSWSDEHAAKLNAKNFLGFLAEQLLELVKIGQHHQLIDARLNNFFHY